MAKLVGHFTGQQTIATSNDALILTAGATIRTEGEEGIVEGFGISGNTIRVLGTVTALPTGPQPSVTAIAMLGANATIEIGRTGLVSGANGIFASGADTDISNAGSILAATSGAGGVGISINSFGNSVTISNSGLIDARLGIGLLTSDAHITNEKGGRIIGHEVGIQMISTGVGNTLTNLGTIMVADQDDVAILGGDDGDTIINSGTILGRIDLGDGDDTFEFRGGTLDGPIEGGEGDDTLIVRKAGVILSEQADDGVDAVKSAVSYTLGDNIEALTLIGKKKIDGTGNGEDNTISGNAGRNTLDGGAGEDWLVGGRGADTLTGGDGLDRFVLSKGFGRDTVIDFIDGEDRLIVSGKGFTGPDDVASHVRQHGDDTWVTLNRKDILVLKDIDSDTVTADDFSFVM